ncbi:MAG: radical SAM protein [Solidesulfovibrio sp.]
MHFLPQRQNHGAALTPQAQAFGRFFRHPEPGRGNRSRIWPVYVTFQGCPGRCVFCAGHLQTGAGPTTPARVLEAMTTGLAAALEAGRGPYELAFYGGVFTNLPAPWPMRFLDVARRFKEAGLVTRVRCSTRPDACSPALLAQLAAAGLDMVELGAQTFCDAVLAASGRGHDAAATRRAAGDVRRVGLGLGLQLLPGLPGHTPEDLPRDAAEAVALAPEIVRLHPCVVADGTPLAALFRAGRFTPWELVATIEALAGVMPVFWRAGVRVARVGLAPEPAFDAALLAGPRHPALGERVRSLALLHVITAEVRALEARPAGLLAPRRFAGELFGHAGELLPAYEALGLPKALVRFEARDEFFLAAAV